MVRAMKTLNKDQMMMENQQKFLAELFILRGLDHPNILRIFELFENEDNYYLIMEYNLLYIFYTNILYYFLQVLLWGELFERIKTVKVFSERQAAKIMKQVLSVILYLNLNSIVHRDIKPENIVFENDKINSTVKVIDFGTARKFQKGKDNFMSKQVGTVKMIL